ncbi:hypothetical protein CRE_15838 [Caenorhabditis remanei]|uniref:F-box domain-containing protein n=1 Tax=Caenorhabditis remanei TaxID=31234 RepID=E3NSF1_CAERE|nr:hypothetical protein CRE_15838 [Caenorhabditis remanei]
MPLKFLNLPYLVQESILRSMNHGENFMMAQCSKRTKYCVIRARLKIPRVWYSLNENYRYVGIQKDGETQLELVAALINWKIDRDFVEVENWDDYDDYGLTGWSQTSDGQKLACTSVLNFKGTITKIFYDHIQLLFRYIEPIALEISVNLFSENMPIFENVSTVFLVGNVLEMKDLDIFFTQYPDLSALMIEPSINGVLADTSSMFEIETVYLLTSRFLATDLLMKFVECSKKKSTHSISVEATAMTLSERVTGEELQFFVILICLRL